MPLFLEQEGEKEGLGLRAGRPKDQKPDRSQASQTGQADRQHRAVYESFNYFYRN